MLWSPQKFQNLEVYFSSARNQEPKKGINIKNLGRNPPSQTPPPKGTPDPANSLCLGPLFPLKYRKKACIKNFERGGLGGPQVLYAEFLCVLFLHLKKHRESIKHTLGGGGGGGLNAVVILAVHKAAFGDTIVATPPFSGRPCD